MNTFEDFTIRPATNGDLPAIREVLFSVRSEFDVADLAHIRDDDLDDLERNYLDRGGAFEVIEDRRIQRIVGCGGSFRTTNAERSCAKCTSKVARAA